MHFLRQFSAVVTLHLRVGAPRLALTPDDAPGGQAELRRMAEIAMEQPAHAQAVEARLAAGSAAPRSAGSLAALLTTRPRTWR